MFMCPQVLIPAGFAIPNMFEFHYYSETKSHIVSWKRSIQIAIIKIQNL